MKVNISAYSGDVVAGDWAPALLAAWDDVKATGGTIYFDTQDTEFKTSTLLTNVASQVNLVIEGDGSTEQFCNTADGSHVINVGSKGLMTLRQMNFHGDAAVGKDTGALAFFSNCINTVIERCAFAGIDVQGGSLLHFLTGTRAVIRDSMFGGCPGTNVDANGCFSLLVENCQFFDYFTLGNVYYDNAGGTPQWIVAHNPPDLEAATGANTPNVIVRNCAFDEGSVIGIDVTDYPKVEIDHCRFNLSSAGGSAGIKLTGVKQAIIRQCHGGYVPADRALIKLIDCENVVVIGQGIDDIETPHPIHIEKDAGTNLKLLQSPGVTVTVV